MTAPPGVPVRVTPQQFHDAARRIADGQNRADDVAARLRTALDGVAGAAGDDRAARDLDRAYTPAADRAFAGLARLTGLIGAIAAGLAVSAENHRRGDAESAPGAATGAPFPAVPTRPAPPAAGRPRLVGRPEYWVPDWAEQYWPNGDPERLRRAGSAWYAAADAVTRLGDDLHGVLSGLVDANDGDDVRALAAYWDRVGRSGTAVFTTLPRTCSALADACMRYAAAVDDAHRTMLDVIGQVLLGAVLVGVGIALTAPTLGASDVVAGDAGAGAITAAVAELETLAAALLAAVGGGLAIAGVAVAGDALVAAIDHTPDPRIAQADMTRLGDGFGKGSVDESARAFPPEERRTAERLAERGHHVRSLPENHGEAGRKCDAEVDGVQTEFKSLSGDPPPGSNSIKNRLGESASGGGQARSIVIDAEDAGLGAADAQRGIGRYLGLKRDDYDKILIMTREGWITWP